MLEGEWHILAVHYGNQDLPNRTGRLEIVGTRFALQIGGTPREVGGVEFDGTADPAILDLIWREPGGGEARRIRAIVRVRGELMQFCYYPESTGPRPPRFSSSGEPPAILIRCRRHTP